MNEELQTALDFVKSERGQYIIAQALQVGAFAYGNNEPRNADDMRYILEKMYPKYNALYFAMQEYFEENAFSLEQLEAVVTQIHREKENDPDLKVRVSEKNLEPIMTETARYLFQKGEIAGTRAEIIRFVLRKYEEGAFFVFGSGKRRTLVIKNNP